MSNKSMCQISDIEFKKIFNESSSIHDALLKMGMCGTGASYIAFKKRCKEIGIELPEQKEYNEKNKRANINNETLLKACSNSFSIAATLKSLELIETNNTNRRWLKYKILELNINIAHWTGQGHLKGKSHNWSAKIPTNNILIENSTYLNTNSLKKRLIKESLLNDVCYVCNIKGEWCEKKLILQLDHINGIRSDNRIDNLRLLCPNCHSQTDTFCSKKRTADEQLYASKIEELKTARKLQLTPKPKQCLCGKTMSYNSKHCFQCEVDYRKTTEYRQNRIANQKTKINWPTDTDLVKILKNNNFLSASKILGVSDNAIRKRLKRRNLLAKI